MSCAFHLCNHVHTSIPCMYYTITTLLCHVGHSTAQYCCNNNICSIWQCSLYGLTTYVTKIFVNKVTLSFLQWAECDFWRWCRHCTGRLRHVTIVSKYGKLSGTSSFCPFGQALRVLIVQIVLGSDYSGSVKNYCLLYRRFYNNIMSSDSLLQLPVYIFIVLILNTHWQFGPLIWRRYTWKDPEVCMSHGN